MFIYLLIIVMSEKISNELDASVNESQAVIIKDFDELTKYLEKIRNEILQSLWINKDNFRGFVNNKITSIGLTYDSYRILKQ